MNGTRAISLSVLLLVTAAGALGCAKSGHDAAKEGATEGEAFGRMTVDELAAKMEEAKSGKSKLLVVDNNQRDVFEKGHIPTAKWVKFDAVKASDLPADKETTLVFYCANEH
jgi:hypothetical protein